MKKWSVSAKVSGSKFLGEFEADTENEAVEKAIRVNGGVSLCHQCCGECEDAELEKVTAEEI